MSFCLDTNVLVSIFFADAHSTRAFAWLERVAEPICISDWAATEFFALAHRRVRAGVLGADAANAALRDFDAFAGNSAQRLSHSAASGALAALEVPILSLVNTPGTDRTDKDDRRGNIAKRTQRMLLTAL